MLIQLSGDGSGLSHRHSKDTLDIFNVVLSYNASSQSFALQHNNSVVHVQLRWTSEQQTIPVFDHGTPSSDCPCAMIRKLRLVHLMLLLLATYCGFVLPVF